MSPSEVAEFGNQRHWHLGVSALNKGSRKNHMGRLSTNHILLLITLPLALACQSGGVGDPCIPEDEYRPDFAGFAETEANAESRSFQCETRVCLVNHFRGRVSCPYGQNVPGQEDVDGVDHSERCRIPGGSDTDLVTVPVQPQLLARRPEDAVYCSCRCGGKDKNARYCQCPSGFSCQELIPDFGFGGEQLSGSYCVRSGTVVDNADTIPQLACSYTAVDANGKHQCGEGITQD